MCGWLWLMRRRLVDNKGYLCTYVHMSKKVVERVQTGVRIEKRLLKVLKAMAEYLDITVGDLLEGIVLHALEGKAPPFKAEHLKSIEDLKRIYGLDLTASDSHKLIEQSSDE